MRLEFMWDEEPRNSLCFASGPIIIGAGPSGLAVAACLRKLKIPSLILERADCIASLWKHNTYDRIHLHLPKRYCTLPHHPLPDDYPTYLSGAQFVEYLEGYAQAFSLKPRFNERVVSARFDEKHGVWRVLTVAAAAATTTDSNSSNAIVREYAGLWLVVASGENAEAVVPSIEGLPKFQGHLCHSRSYKNACLYQGKKVLVVGCGNSGMEIALDLIKSGAQPSIVVRNSVHVLPQEILGKSTFAIISTLVKIFPVWLADRLLLFCAWCKWSNTAKCGLPRPKDGPIAHKNRARRTPVLDIGTLYLIKTGLIKVYPGIKTFTQNGATFTNGESDNFDAVILATGYRSNVRDWLVGEEDQFTTNGLPLPSSTCGWKGRKGLYTVGMSGMGLVGTCIDAQRIALDIQLEFERFCTSLSTYQS